MPSRFQRGAHFGREEKKRIRLWTGEEGEETDKEMVRIQEEEKYIYSFPFLSKDVVMGSRT